MQRPGHGDEVGEDRTGGEEQRSRQQERQEGFLLLDVESGRDEPPELRRQHREAQHQRGEQPDLHLHEESLENVDVNEPALAGPEQGLHQDRENVAREIEADEEGRDERREAPEQPPAKLDQMLEQGLLGLVDVLHGSGRFSGGSSSPSGLASGGMSSGWPGS